MQASPSAGGLSGGLCGGPCDGVSLDVGYWEREFNSIVPAGYARQNSRVSSNTVTGYLDCPATCATDAECQPTPNTNDRICRLQADGNKICVQDHLTWTVASTGMNGAYSYDTTAPNGPDPTPNTTGESFSSTGAWYTDKRFGNNMGEPGLNFLVAPGPAVAPCQIPDAPPTMFINRSQSAVPLPVADFAGRTFGSFLTIASGNSNSSFVACGGFRNGLCVGGYDYRTFSDQTTHRRMIVSGDTASSFINPNGFGDLERPHLLGPSSHSPGGVGQLFSGLHLPAIDVGVGSSLMRHDDYTITPVAIVGTSFASPTVLSAAMQALQYKGLFSSLVFPMVNKAVLLAATVDANADGPVGKANTWSANAPTLDSEDGAGQINLLHLASILTNNTYFFSNAADSNFSSCGTNCRKYAVASFTISAAKRVRAVLAWQTCTSGPSPTSFMNNDLDLALVCTGTACPGTLISNTVSSETEMFERQVCSGAQKSATASCTLEVRIKNGVPLNACGSTATERIGVAWRIQ